MAFKSPLLKLSHKVGIVQFSCGTGVFFYRVGAVGGFWDSQKRLKNASEGAVDVM